MNTYYTTQMLADPNASNAGFLAVLIFLIALACFYILFDFEGFVRDSKTIVFVSTVIVSIAAYFSYFYPFDVPMNEPVTATLVNTFESPYNVSGKRSKTVQGNYVTYKVPEGEVVFLRGSGQVFPETVILYRQRNEE